MHYSVWIANKFERSWFLVIEIIMLTYGKYYLICIFNHEGKYYFNSIRPHIKKGQNIYLSHREF